jgi:Na+/melibiose symporter-like transporter
VKETFQQIFLPTKDPQYRLWMGNAFCFNMSLRILIIMLMPYLTFVLLVEGVQFTYFMLAVIPFAGVGYVFWTKLIKSHGLKHSFSTSLKVSVLVSVLTPIFLIPMAAGLRFGLGIIIMGIAISSLVGGYLFPNPIVTRLVDAAPEEIKKTTENSGKGISGSYFGLYIFTYNIAQAISNLILGFILTGENKSNPTIIALGLPIAGIITFLAYLFLKPMNLPKMIVTDEEILDETKKE